MSFNHHALTFKLTPIQRTGRALLRFEKYGQTLALRVVKLITPVQCTPGYDGYLPIPAEGELVHIRQIGSTLDGLRRPLKPWTVTKAKLASNEAMLDLIHNSQSRLSEHH